MSDLNPEDRLLLGMVDWRRADWMGDYYPEDLPADWRLSYLANDCECVMLPAEQWCVDDEGLDAAVDDAPESLLFLLQTAVRGLPSARHLARFDGCRVALLAEKPVAAGPAWPQFLAAGADCWADASGAALVERWVLESTDLRRLRDRAAVLDPKVRMLLIDGPAANPGIVPELRTLLQLMGSG